MRPYISDHYHASLCAALATNGAAASAAAAAAVWTRGDVQTQYESAVLDLCRVVFGYQWARVKASPEVLKDNEASMGKVRGVSSNHPRYQIVMCITTIFIGPIYGHLYQMTSYADRLGGSNGDGAWRGMVTIVELIDPRPYIFSLPDLGGSRHCKFT